jgi:serine/threonine-protein kinase RsbT
MEDTSVGEVKIITERDIVKARKLARDKSKEIGFGITDVTRIVTATSELSRNIFQYAGTGIMQWRIIEKEKKLGIELIFEDHGPGILDIEKAMEMGYTTSKGLGLGLPGAKKLIDNMIIESEVNKGTRITIQKWVNG